MLSLVFLAIFIVSFLGMVFMVAKKWPELKAVSVFGRESLPKPFSKRIRQGIRGLKPMPGFSSEKFLKKFFIRLKILLLKAERRIDKYLHRVSHSQKFEDDYWREIKKGK